MKQWFLHVESRKVKMKSRWWCWYWYYGQWTAINYPKRSCRVPRFFIKSQYHRYKNVGMAVKKEKCILIHHSEQNGYPLWYNNGTRTYLCCLCLPVHNRSYYYTIDVITTNNYVREEKLKLVWIVKNLLCEALVRYNW